MTDITTLPPPALWFDQETGHWKTLTKPDRPTYEPYYSAEQMRAALAQSAQAPAHPAAPSLLELQQRFAGWSAPEVSGTMLRKGAAPAQPAPSDTESDLPARVWLNDNGTEQKLSFAPIKGAYEHFEYVRAAQPAPSVEAVPAGAIVAAYTLAANRDVRIERAMQMDGSEKWAVRRHGDCLDRSGQWEYEPLPSSRDDDFLARCRFDSASEAIAAAVEALARGAK